MPHYMLKDKETGLFFKPNRYAAIGHTEWVPTNARVYNSIAGLVTSAESYFMNIWYKQQENRPKHPGPTPTVKDTWPESHPEWKAWREASNAYWHDKYRRWKAYRKRVGSANCIPDQYELVILET